MQRNTPKAKEGGKEEKYINIYIYTKRASTVITESANLIQKENGYRAPINWAPPKRREEKEGEGLIYEVEAVDAAVAAAATSVEPSITVGARAGTPMDPVASSASTIFVGQSREMWPASVHL
jgi:hypothetical protein